MEHTDFDDVETEEGVVSHRAAKSSSSQGPRKSRKRKQLSIGLMNGDGGPSTATGVQIADAFDMARAQGVDEQHVQQLQQRKRARTEGVAPSALSGGPDPGRKLKGQAYADYQDRKERLRKLVMTHPELNNVQPPDTRWIDQLTPEQVEERLAYMEQHSCGALDTQFMKRFTYLATSTLEMMHPNLQGLCDALDKDEGFQQVGGQVIGGTLLGALPLWLKFIVYGSSHVWEVVRRNMTMAEIRATEARSQAYARYQAAIRAQGGSATTAQAGPPPNPPPTLPPQTPNPPPAAPGVPPTQWE